MITALCHSSASLLGGFWLKLTCDFASPTLLLQSSATEERSMPQHPASSSLACPLAQSASNRKYLNVKKKSLIIKISWHFVVSKELDSPTQNKIIVVVVIPATELYLSVTVTSKNFLPSFKNCWFNQGSCWTESNLEQLWIIRSSGIIHQLPLCTFLPLNHAIPLHYNVCFLWRIETPGPHIFTAIPKLTIGDFLPSSPEGQSLETKLSALRKWPAAWSLASHRALLILQKEWEIWIRLPQFLRSANFGMGNVSPVWNSESLKCNIGHAGTSLLFRVQSTANRHCRDETLQ